MYYSDSIINYTVLDYRTDSSEQTKITPNSLSFKTITNTKDAKERVGCGKQPHLSNPSKTEAWVSEFAVEDLPLSRTASLVPEFAVKDLPLGRIPTMMIMMTLLCAWGYLRWIG